jgi:hypothetical protein
MNQPPSHLLEVVALLEDLPERQLHRGDVGTVVELLGPDVVEVEFANEAGRTLGLAPIPLRQLLPLRAPILFRKTA